MTWEQVAVATSHKQIWAKLEDAEGCEAEAMRLLSEATARQVMPVSCRHLQHKGIEQACYLPKVYAILRVT